MSTGCLYFFNIPVTLSFTERERHIEYIEKILTEPNNVEIRLVDGNFVDDFKNKDNPSLLTSYIEPSIDLNLSESSMIISVRLGQ